jgi:hypothetical protein
LVNTDGILQTALQIVHGNSWVLWSWVCWAGRNLLKWKESNCIERKDWWIMDTSDTNIHSGWSVHYFHSIYPARAFALQRCAEQRAWSTVGLRAPQSFTKRVLGL